MISGERSRLARVAMAVAWPSFLMAGVLEVLVFAMVDPSELRAFGGESIALSRQAIYAMSFLMFWGVTALTASLSVLLATTPAPAR